MRIMQETKQGQGDVVTDDYISVYTRSDALADGSLKDVTEWASSETGFRGGFTVPVAVSRQVWLMLEDIPHEYRYQDLRGRAHDLLWMAGLAARRQSNTSHRRFSVFLPTRDGEEHSFIMQIHGGDGAEPVITIRALSEAGYSA